MTKLSVQLFSLRELGDLPAQLALTRRVGYEWVESVATHGLPPAEFAALLQTHELKLSSMHAALTQLESQRDTLVEACRLTGCPLIVMPFLPYGERPVSAAGWRAMGERLAAHGRALAAHGLRLAYHNHDWEFLNFDGRCGLEWLFDSAPAADLGWEADLGWATRAGCDAQAWAQRYANRLVAVHAKDIAPEGVAVDEDHWAALGDGIVPWRPLAAALRGKVDLFVLEHDKPRDHERVLSRSLAFMQANFL